VDLYSAFIEVPYTQGAWGVCTVFAAFYTCSADAIVANCLFLQYYCRFPSMPKAENGD